MRTIFRSPVSRIVGAGTLAALTLLTPPRPASAQNAASANAGAVRTAFLGQLDELQGKFLQLAEAFPAAKYSWRPAPGVRSVGEVFKHVAIEYYMYDPMAFGAVPSPAIGHGPDASKKFEAASTKPEAIQALKDGFAYTKQVIGAVSPDSLTGTRRCSAATSR